MHGRNGGFCLKQPVNLQQLAAFESLVCPKSSKIYSVTVVCGVGLLGGIVTATGRTHHEADIASKAFDLVGAVAFVATILPCFLKLSPDDSFLFNLIGFEQFAAAALLGCIVGGIVSVLIASLGLTNERLVLPVVLCAIVFYLGGFLAPILLPTVAHSMIVGGFLFGITLVVLCGAWILCVKSTDFRTILFFCALCGLCAVLLNQVLYSLSPEIVTNTQIVLLVVGILPLLIKVITGKLSFPRSKHALALGIEDNIFIKKSSITDLFLILATSTLGLMIYTVLSNSRQNLLAEWLISETAFGLGIATCVILFASQIARSKPALPFVYWVLFPAVAGALLLLNTFPVGSGPFQFGAIAVFVFYSALGLFAVALILTVNNQGEYSPIFVIGIALSLFALSALVGYALRQAGLDQDERGSLLLVVSTGYLIYLIVSPSIQLWRMRKNTFKEAEDDLKADELNVGETCKGLAEKYELSAREEEILAFVSRGYNSPYIAKALFISDSTVRSHLKSIYRKTGVTSRMELLDLTKKEAIR